MNLPNTPKLYMSPQLTVVLECGATGTGHARELEDNYNIPFGTAKRLISKLAELGAVEIYKTETRPRSTFYRLTNIGFTMLGLINEIEQHQTSRQRKCN